MFKEEYLRETYRKMRDGGLLLASSYKRRPNIMTIGWGFVGILWGRPFFIVAVRKPRYTHRCIESTMDFTVNVPGKGMGGVLRYCGTVSGRDHDKVKDLGLRLGKPRSVSSPVIRGCTIIYECKVIYKVNVNPRLMPKGLLSQIYPHRDFHTFYFGEIVACYRSH